MVHKLLSFQIITGLVALFAASMVAADTRNMPYCSYACEDLVLSQNFNCIDYTSNNYALCICNNKAVTSSIALCTYQYCGEEAKKSYSIVSRYCNSENVPYDWSYEDALAYAQENVNTSADLISYGLQTAPFEIPEESYQSMLPTEIEYYGNEKFAEIYGLAFFLLIFT
ncbi:uncharacterized protein V2V93DRAFT_371185 [Kockiozyma suomiensis]|uniref:uncharacterized protein n=1 Tax=Kockiozyma suomiensis TaxID=1337062 RepID=UPI003343DBE5